MSLALPEERARLKWVRSWMYPWQEPVLDYAMPAAGLVSMWASFFVPLDYTSERLVSAFSWWCLLYLPLKRLDS